MNTFSLFGLLASAGLAFSQAFSGPPTPAAQNTIMLKGYSVYSTGSEDISGPYQGHLHVSFQNDGDVAATAVTFDLLDGDVRTDRIRDVGTFSKGATINHDFHWLNASQGESLQIAEVRYADGTVWSGGSSAQRTLRRQQ